MVNINAAFPSKWLKAADFDAVGTILTISTFSIEEMKDDEGRIENRPALYFAEDERGLILNRTNAAELEEMFDSPDTDDWIGKQVVLFQMKVQYKDRRVPAIRVRAVDNPTSRAQGPRPATPAQTARPPLRDRLDEGWGSGNGAVAQANGNGPDEGGVNWTQFHIDRKAAGLSLDEAANLCEGMAPKALFEQDPDAFYAAWEEIKSVAAAKA